MKLEAGIASPLVIRSGTASCILDRSADIESSIAASVIAFMFYTATVAIIVTEGRRTTDRYYLDL